MVEQDRIEAYLDQENTYQTYSDILSQAGLEDADESLVGYYVRRLIDKELAPGDFVEAIKKEFGTADDISVQIAKGVAERVLKSVEADLPFALGELIRGKEKEIASPLDRLGARNDMGALDQEIEDMKQNKAAVIQARGPLDVLGIVKEICENPAFAFQDALLQERCLKLIESRVRDVRSPEQTRAQLEKSVEKGGLSVSGRRLSDMLALIEGRVAAYHGNLNQAEKQKRIDQRAALPNKVDLAKKEETLLTKKYIQLTGKVPDAHVAPAAPNLSRTSVAISAHHEQIAREGKIDTTKVKEAIQGAQQSAVAPRPRVTPSMQEVTFDKRLSGPIDELRSLTLVDFRRLSKDVMQAATKVKDKVDLLEEQGYDKKVEAIGAWRDCALNQMYVGLTREAILTGTSVAELLSRKRVAGEETLSDEELKAVMKLNEELRF